MTSGAIFVGYNVGNIAASYTVKTEEAAIKYRSTWITVIVSMVAASAAMLVLRVMLQRENRRRGVSATATAPEVRREETGDKVVMELDEYADLTDRQIPEFRYTL